MVDDDIGADRELELRVDDEELETRLVELWELKELGVDVEELSPRMLLEV